MINSLISYTRILLGLFVLAGCAAPVGEPERTGFLSDYSKLEMQEEDKSAIPATA